MECLWGRKRSVRRASGCGSARSRKLIWSAPAERSGDGAVDLRRQEVSTRIQSGVAIALCRRTPNFCVTMTAMIAEKTFRAELLDGRVAADAIKREVAAAVTALKRERDVTPRLAAVIVGDDPASAVYVRNKIRACAEVGIASEHLPMPAATTTRC